MSLPANYSKGKGKMTKEATYRLYFRDDDALNWSGYVTLKAVDGKLDLEGDPIGRFKLSKVSVD